MNPAVKSSTFTADNLNSLYLCSGTITANLPTAASINGKMYAIVNTGTGVITVDPSSTQTIGGRSTWLLYRDSAIIIASDGTNWQVIAQHRGNSGTAFPTDGLYSGLEYFRTDLGVLCSYDGTRWLGPETPIALHNYRGAPAFSATEEILATGLRDDRALYLTRFSASYYTGGGVDGSNYWRIYLRRLTSGISVDNIVYIQTTNNNWYKEADKTAADMSNNPLNASDIWLQVWIEKTGSPNSIYVQAQVHGRYVYT
jgi:hypothetical protein